MGDAVKKAATEVCSILQYYMDRDGSEHIKRVETRVRYTDKEVNEFIVHCGGKRIRFTAEEIGEGITGYCDLCGEEYYGEIQEDPKYPGYEWCGRCTDE